MEVILLEHVEQTHGFLLCDWKGLWVKVPTGTKILYPRATLRKHATFSYRRAVASRGGAFLTRLTHCTYILWRNGGALCGHAGIANCGNRPQPEFVWHFLAQTRIIPTRIARLLPAIRRAASDSSRVSLRQEARGQPSA